MEEEVKDKMKKEMNTWTPKLITQILCTQNYN
jgi:hypothetical protein